MPLYNNHEQYTALYNQLEFYDPLSIDSFLSQFSDKKMIDAGKAMIAYEILESEDRELLQRSHAHGTEKKRSENWYRFLHHAITSNATPHNLIEDELKLNIVTFNYDNSLEYSLYSRFHNSPLLATKSAPFLQKISDNIVHVYGQVGKFQWKGGQDRANNDYGEYKGDAALTRAEEEWKDTIYVIGQDREDRVRKNAAIAQEWLKKADIIYFLGFGFNDDNVNLLKLKENTQGAGRIYCTNYGDSQIIAQKIQYLFSRNAYSKVVDGKTILLRAREAVVSKKTVHDALAGDFNLIG